MDARQHYEAGHLAEAVDAAIAAVRQKPTDLGLRAFLAELLCIAGDLERADKQLDALATQAPESAVNVAVFRQLVRAEQSRREFFSAGRLPEFLHEPTDALRKQLEASICLREDDREGAQALLAEAEELRPQCRGTCDGEAFDDFRDLDDLTAPAFEVLTSTGKYYWVPFETVDLVEFRAPETPRDLLWRPARMVVRGGPDGEVYLPVTYADTHVQEDNALKLARATDWLGEEGQIVRGLGQRTYLVGEEDRPLMTITELTFET